MQSLWCCEFFLFHQAVFVLFSSVFLICCWRRKLKFLHFLESQTNIWTKHKVHFAMCVIKRRRASSWSADLGNPFHKIRDKHWWRTGADSGSPLPFWSNLKRRAASFLLWRASQVCTSLKNAFIISFAAANHEALKQMVESKLSLVNSDFNYRRLWVCWWACTDTTPKPWHLLMKSNWDDCFSLFWQLDWTFVLKD